MIEALAAISGTGLLGALAAVVYLAIRVANQSEQLADARVAQATTEEHLAEAQYKLDQTQLALTSALKLNTAQAKELADAIGTPPNPDLPPDDVHDRVARLLAQFTVSSTDNGAGPATDRGVPPNGTTGTAPPRAG